MREFWGSIVGKLKERESGIFITTGRFTQESIDFVEDKPIKLITGEELEKINQNEK